MCLWWSTLICRGSSSGGTSETLSQLQRAVPAAEGAPGAALASSRVAAAAAAAAFGSLLIAPKAFFSSESRPPARLGDLRFTNFPVFQSEPIPSGEASLPLHFTPAPPPKRNLFSSGGFYFIFLAVKCLRKPPGACCLRDLPLPPAGGGVG